MPTVFMKMKHETRFSADNSWHRNQELHLIPCFVSLVSMNHEILNPKRWFKLTSGAKNRSNCSLKDNETNTSSQNRRYRLCVQCPDKYACFSVSCGERQPRTLREESNREPWRDQGSCSPNWRSFSWAGSPCSYHRIRQASREPWCRHRPWAWNHRPSTSAR